MKKWKLPLEWIEYPSVSDGVLAPIYLIRRFLSSIYEVYINLLTISDFQPYWFIIKFTWCKSTILLLRECHKSLIKCYRQASQIMFSLRSSSFMYFWNHSKYESSLPHTTNILRVLQTLTTITLSVVAAWNFWYLSQESIARLSDNVNWPISLLVPQKKFGILE